MTEKGTYSLLINLNERKSLKIGSLGNKELNKGFYIYTGSAFGPGGISRIKNHMKIDKGIKNRKKWHIDYLTSLISSSIREIFLTPEKEECKIARNIQLEPVNGFGCTDCGCLSHLHYSDSKEKTLKQLKNSYEKNTEDFRKMEPEEL